MYPVASINKKTTAVFILYLYYCFSFIEFCVKVCVFHNNYPYSFRITIFLYVSKKITMNNQEISLKWNGFQSNILSNVKELYKDEGLSDVTLVSEGQCFKAHKVILSANSVVFRGIFQVNTNLYIDSFMTIIFSSNTHAFFLSKTPTRIQL